MPQKATSGVVGPRRLLRDLRAAMAQPLSTQGRLDAIVEVIAQNMKAEVCSAYLLGSTDTLELFATKGLNPGAVHETRMKLGEGLVGHIALTEQSLNLQDAQSHPNFAYKPETGEELFKSFLGVPILRGGRLLGVLVVQNSKERTYSEDDAEALQLVAMVFAEMIASGDVIGSDETHAGDLRRDASWRCHGTALADGIAMGHAVLHQPRVEVTRLIADDVDQEVLRLEEGIDALRDSIDEMLMADDLALVGDSMDVLEAYRMFAHDRGWRDQLLESARGGLTAEAAVEKVLADTRARLVRSPDPYLRERLNDFDDLSNRLLRHLIGSKNLQKLPDDAILVARFMGPAELLDYDRKCLRGVILEEGSPTAHVTIVAKALDVPLVGRAAGAVDRIEPEDPVIVDGEHGEVHARPKADVVDAYRHKVELREQRQARYIADKDLPAVTLDGEEINLDINAGLLVDLPHLQETGASGIGLFRTELQFMIGATMPRLNVQRDLYRSVLDAAEDRRVVFRTVDLGSDKVVPYLHTEPEENPALGWRAIRLALDRPALLRYQIRALLQAAEGRELNLMFPLIAEVAEFQAAKTLVDREVEWLRRLGRPLPVSTKVGTMLEVPSLIWQLDALLPCVDFLSIGSNDLLQFFFASDRGNPKLAGRYDPLSPAVLTMLKQVVEKAAANHVSLSLCGDMAGGPLEAMALIGLGLRRISMPPASVGPVKAMLRSLDSKDLCGTLNRLILGPDHSLREALKDYARDHKVVLG